ncbi:MAG: hypothetical protein QXW55_00715 [Candidatus Bathyarchaeia archaeon]
MRKIIENVNEAKPVLILKNISDRGSLGAFLWRKIKNCHIARKTENIMKNFDGVE